MKIALDTTMSKQFIQDNIQKYFHEYSKLCNTVQIKFKGDLPLELSLTDIIQTITEAFSSEIIIHMKSKDIHSLGWNNEVAWYQTSCFNNCKLVTHIASLDDFVFIQNQVKEISNIIFFLENSKSICNKELFIDEIDHYITENHSTQIKLCLDVGHLFCGETVNNQLELMNVLLVKKNLLANVAIFHIHDFISYSDHQKIFTGELSKFVVKNLLLNCPNSSIILEIPLGNFDEMRKEINTFRSL